MNSQPDKVRAGAVLGPGTKKEMFGGFEMKITGRIQAIVFSTLMITALLFLFGTPAEAARNRRGPQAQIVASPNSLSFSGTVGATLACKSLAVSSSNSTSLPVTLGGSASWIAVTPSSGTTNVQPTPSVCMNTAGLAAGSYSGSLVITVTNGSNSILHVPVSLKLTAAAVTYQIVPTPSSLSFSGAVGATLSCQSVVVYANPATSLPVTLAGSAAWITVTPTSGTTQVQPTPSVCVNTAGLAAGSYSGSMIITTTNGTGSNSPLHVPVSLTLTNSVVAPTITTQPASKTITAGQTATFTVAANGSSPMSYQWSKNGTAMSGATSSTYTTSAETTTDNNATFSVMVSNSAGNAASSAAILTVNAAAVAPTITSQPASQSVNAGQTATFNVAATGTSPMTYQWSKNSVAISGATSSTYSTPAETTSDNSAKFTVAVSNSAGSAASSAAILTVNAVVTAPAISTQPASQTVLAGQTATFSVSATGTSPMTYQWSKNGVAISGANSSSYTTPAEISSDNSAKFTAVVTNSAGSATSNAATLTVSAGTLILNSSVSSLSFGNVNVSSPATQNVTLTNTGNSAVTVSAVTLAGAGISASGVSTGLILNPAQTATLAVTFNPSGAGSVTGNVTVASNASNSPDAVTLTGTGVAVTNYAVDLSWTASTSTVMGYNTYSSTVSGGPYNKLTSSPAAGTSYADSTVQAGKTYYYVVSSVGSSGTESAYSSQVSATIP